MISHWLSTRYTVEFMGVWEKINNPNFNVTEFSNIKNESGGNGYVLTSKQWIEKTNAIGIIAKPGRYGGGTYSNMESINALLIRQGLAQSERLIQLNSTAITQMKSLISGTLTRRLK